MRVASYARYSSDQQRDASIEDQLRECRAHAAKQGWAIVAEYHDAAMSGASINRPGISALLSNLSDYDIILTESLDRVSRDQEDTARFCKRLNFQRVQFFTLSEGLITELHVGFKSTMNALYLKDLAEKTRRGLRGRVEAGRSGGGLCYGYRVVTATDSESTGVRAIDRVEAGIIARIFVEYAEGSSPKAIAKRLNAEGIPGPRGRAWGPSTIHGHAGRGTGILNNELYVSRLVWNRQRYVKDPSTGRRVSRRNPRELWTVTPVEALRIVSDDVWNAAKSRQRDTRLAVQGSGTLTVARRNKYLFSGLIKCGVCGSSYTMASRARLACAGATNRGTCTNTTTIRRDEIERRVLKAMEERLWNQELFEEFCREFTRELNRLRGEANGAIAAAREMLKKVNIQIDKGIDWITT